MTLTDWLLVLATFLGGGVIGSLISWQAQKVSERHADARHLRDLRADRLREIFKPLLHVAQVRTEAIHRRKYTLVGETQEGRDEIVNTAIRRAMEGFTTAMVAIQLEPHAGKKIVDLFQETFAEWTAYQIEVGSRETAREQGGPFPSVASLDAQETKANEAVKTMHDEMIRVLDELEQPMPPKGRWRFWERRTPERTATDPATREDRGQHS